MSLLAAAREALVLLERSISHGTFCGIRTVGGVGLADVVTDCTCGAWETIDKLRTAIEKEANA